MPCKDSSMRALVGCRVLALVTERVLRREYCLCGRSEGKPCVCQRVLGTQHWSAVDELVCTFLVAEAFLAAPPHVPNNYSSSVRGTLTTWSQSLGLPLDSLETRTLLQFFSPDEATGNCGAGSGLHLAGRRRCLSQLMVSSSTINPANRHLSGRRGPESRVLVLLQWTVCYGGRSQTAIRLPEADTPISAFQATSFWTQTTIIRPSVSAVHFETSRAIPSPLHENT
jgi:hypothetical protein